MAGTTSLSRLPETRLSNTDLLVTSKPERTASRIRLSGVLLRSRADPKQVASVTNGAIRVEIRRTGLMALPLIVLQCADCKDKHFLPPCCVRRELKRRRP